MSDESENEEKESKSQRKREMSAAQRLGESLIPLSEEQLSGIPLSDNLRAAVRQAQKIKSHGALRRQRQFIGRLMRNEDTAQIAEALEKLKGTHVEEVHALHQAERWRDRLLNEGDTAVTEFVGLYPKTDVTRLRQLLRNARKQQQSPASNLSRVLFRYIRSVITEEDT